MRRFIILGLLITIHIMAFSQNKIILTANGKSLTATLADNTAAAELMHLLPMEVNMSPYGGFEVVGQLPQSLPAADRQITTVPGDIMLYLGRQIVIFYDSNTWDYTPLGRIDSATAATVKEFLGSGNVMLTISALSSGIEEIGADQESAGEVFDLNGRRVASGQLTPGVYVSDGKKIRVN